jgi:hypothetical protein
MNGQRVLVLLCLCPEFFNLLTMSFTLRMSTELRDICIHRRNSAFRRTNPMLEHVGIMIRHCKEIISWR